MEYLFPQMGQNLPKLFHIFDNDYGIQAYTIL
ncbi:hypothetical protein HNQ56_002980 [Anaerotaenia torta]